MFNLLDVIVILALIWGLVIGFIGSILSLLMFIIETFWYQAPLKKNIGIKMFKWSMKISLGLIVLSIIIDCVLYIIEKIGQWFGFGSWWYL